MATKKILQREWAKMKTVSEPTETTGRIKADGHGTLLEWVAGGKRVTVRVVAINKRTAV